MSFENLKNLIAEKRRALRKRKRLIVYLSILAVLGLTTATYAWFTVNTFASIEDFDIEITTGEELKVSMENHGSNIDLYTDTITVEMVDSYLDKYDTSVEEMVLTPVTTNNGSDFTYQYGDAAEVNGDYLEYECYFIATRDMWVHLTTESAEDKPDSGTKVSSSSSAPKNEVTQAIRVDFETSSNGVATYEPNKGSAVTDLTTFDLPSGTMTYSNSNRLFHLDKLTPKKVTVRLWLEGEDPQCDNDVQKANLSVQLSFVGCDDNSNPIS